MLKFDLGQVAGVTIGEGSIWASGDNTTGKSMVFKVLKNREYGMLSPAPFKKVNTWQHANGETWYTVSMRKDVSIWFHEQFADQEDKMWRATNDTNWTHNMTEMNEKLYIMLELRWS